MALTTYTRNELRDIVLDHIRGRVPGANVARFSDFWHIATAIATVVHGDQAAAQYLVQQVLPSTAEKVWLDEHASMRTLTRRQPTKARGKILVAATALTSITAGTALTHASGGEYIVSSTALAALPSWSALTTAPGCTRTRLIPNPDATGVVVDDVLDVDGHGLAAAKAVVPDVGTPIAIDLYVPYDVAPSAAVTITPTAGAVIEVEAVEAGAAGNLAPGDALPFDTVPSGVSTVPVVLEMTGGGDLETDAELRARVLDWMAERPGSGNRADYRQWARETPDVTLADAMVYPSYRGLGTVDVVPIGITGARVTGLVVNDLVQAHLEDEASFQDDILVRQLANTAAVDVAFEIQVGPGYEPDWIGSYTSHGTQAELNEVKLTASPDAVEVGDRVLVLAGTAAPQVYQREVTGKKSGNILVLDEDLPALPGTGLEVHPGGPNAQALIDAIVALFDSLGPGDTSPPSRFPAPLDAFPDTLHEVTLTSTVKGVAGVVDVHMNTPTTDQVPATLQRLVLGRLTLQITTDAVG